MVLYFIELLPVFNKVTISKYLVLVSGAIVNTQHMITFVMISKLGSTAVSISVLIVT